ncbi:MAG: hypothetical protein GKS03_03465 [Alphaproteobacteria bacterium]|nr:hypothetical protein [Alphaproteobacteria bacterium]
MSDLTITSARILIAPAVSDFGIAPFNQRGITSTGGPTTSTGRLGIVVDSVTLSADARALLGQVTSGGFDSRTGAVSQLIDGVGSGTQFGAVDLNGAIFFGQDLSGSVFNGTILTDANFSGVDLSNTRFINSLVSGANFNQANISGADLTGAQGLTFDQISGATFSTSTAFPQDIGNQILGNFTGIG